MASSTVLQEFSLEGKGALVVGAENAVGRASAITLSQAGAKVLLASQEPGTDKQLKEVAKAVQAAGSKAVIRVQNAAIRADLSPAAQQLYCSAFSSAWKRYADFADREPFCHRIARSTVRRREGLSSSGGQQTAAAHHIGS
jgi:NAD(P)-dependent dehydrogenase (short-subunit alcohol dehydrogenase family)